MFLIAASSNKPEMYEIHTSSKAERNTWMALIRQAVESCPEGEVKVKGQEEGQGARAVKLKQFQEHLTRRDALIEQNLTEKLQIFAFFLDDLTVECLQNLLLTRMKACGPALEDVQAESLQLHRAQTFGGFDTRPPISPLNGGEGDESQAQAEEELLESSRLSTSLEPGYRDPEMYRESPELSFFDRVLQLSQRLYSLQAVIAQQDSRTDQQELQWPGMARRNSSDLLEQERQRNQEKWREEQTGFRRQQVQHQQELQRWEKEREKECTLAEQQEARLAEREEACARLEERLATERVELEDQRADYQGDLVRLRESTQKYLQVSQSFRIDKRRLSPELRAEPTATSNANSSPNTNHKHISGEGGGGGCEVPPTVPPRKESMSPAQAVKAEVPIQLVSTTNQPHKAGGVQQQIPTKLAAHSKGSKSSRSHHRSSHQRAASIDMSQVVPIKTTGKEGGSLRAKKGASPQRIQSVFTQHTVERLTQRPTANMKPSQSFSVHNRSHNTPPPEPPPFPKDVLKKKERVVFL
ncbi:hypothetical protein CRUP_014393 [Coryphaenoides rupestris]|nr:hypothetical protein CRUP_014393 [Coryphaenoides rupestris]